MLFHLSDEMPIAFQVVITRDEKSRSTRDGGFEYTIIIGISAQMRCTCNGHNGCAACDQSKVLNDILFTDLIPSLEAGTPKHIGDLFENGQRAHDVDGSIEPGLHQAKRRPLFG